MSEYAKPIQNEGKVTSITKLDDIDTLRDMELCERCVCDCRHCNTYNDLQKHGSDGVRTEYGTRIGACAGGSPTTSTARRRANLQYTNLRFRQSPQHPGTSKHMQTRKLRKLRLNINLKVRNITKRITTKYLQKIRLFIATKNTTAKRNLFQSHRKINQLDSLMQNRPRRMNKHHVHRTASRPELSMAHSIKTLKASAMFSSASSSNTTITPHTWKQRKNSRKLIAANLFSKLMQYLKPFLGIVMKSPTTKNMNRTENTSNKRPTVAFDYIFPYQCHLSNTLHHINNQSSMLNTVSDISAAAVPNSSIQSLNDQGIQVSDHSVVRDADVNVENFVKRIPKFNVYSQCILSPNDVLFQYRNKNAKMVIKKSRRVMFRGHHKRFMTKTYRQNFNKTYHTFLAEINYTNQPSMPCPISRQGVGIGSTWDVCIDFGRSQEFPVQGGAAAGKGDNSNALQSSITHQFQCTPGVCVTGACNSKVCYKRLKKSVPYGSHVSTQSRMYKLRDGKQRAGREKIHGRKQNMTKRRKNQKGRESRPGSNQTGLLPPILPSRQTVRIGSKCSFNVKLYKETPIGARTVQFMNRKSSGQNGQCNTTVCRKAARSTKKRKPLKTFECQPGICVPGKCNASDCLKQLECKPKVCVPGKCDPSDCYRRQRATFTDTSLVFSSNCSSEVSTQARRLKGRDLRAGRETFYKEKGILSKPRTKAQLNMPNRQAVRIGSKCSFNIEFYKCLPQNGMSEPNRCDTSDERKGPAKKAKSLKKYQCEPGVCLPGKCNANQCFQQIKIKQSTCTDASSQGSQASTKRQGLRAEKCTFYSEKGVSCMPRSKMPLQMGNRQAVRIGSKCSFNIEFYKSLPYNGPTATPMSEPAATVVKGKPRKKYQCDPAICVTGTCNPNECLQAIQTKNETSVCESSFTGSSRGSQATPKRRKDKTRVLKSGKATFYKDTGVSSLPCARRTLHMPNRQAVRIGSTCSFNIEFYKCSPHDGAKMNGQNFQSTRSLPKTGKPRGIFECEPGVCIPGKCNPSECFKQFECKPKVCVPGKCDPVDCIQRLRGTPTGTDSPFTGSSVSTQSRKFKRGKIRGVDKTLYKEKGVSSIPMPKPTIGKPNRQVVRIGSNCSFNIEFYKAMSHPMMGDQNYPPGNFYNQGDNGKNRGALKKYQCGPGACIPGKCVPVECYNRIKRSQMSEYDQSDSSDRYKAGSRKKHKAFNMYECPPGVCIPGKCNAMECYNRLKALRMSDQSDTSGKSRKKRKSLKKYECEPGICVPGKCNPKECFQLFKARQSTDNDESLTDSSFATSRASQASKKRKSKLLEFTSGNAKFYTERGASSMPRPRTPLHMQNRAAVRIGSTCSFNIEFYKEIPHKRGRESNAQQIQDRQYPFQYNIDHNRQYPSQYYPSSSETSGDRTVGMKCECTRQLAELDKKETFTGKREKPGKKESRAGKGKKGTGKTKQPPGQQAQGDTTVQQTTSSTGMKSKELKRKTTQNKQSSSKNEQGDITTKPKLSSKGQAMMVKGKRTRGKQSQTTVRDQQSETSVDEKVGTDKLQNQGDTTIESNVETKKIGKGLKDKPNYGQSVKGFEYEFGVCIPNKCDPHTCFERLRNRNEGTSTEGSLSAKSKLSSRSSDTGSMSKSTNVNFNKKEEAERRKIQSSALPVYKQMGTSSIATSKYGEDIPQRIPPLGTPSRKKQVVRIGSTCSFNIQFFKDKPLTPAQLASLRSASTPPKPEVPEVNKERQSFTTYVKKCCCRIMRQLNEPPCTNVGGTQHGSQTSSKLDCRPAFCDFARCATNQCPASCNMATGIDTYGRPKSCCTNAATQSRRCPRLSMNDNSLSAALCKCVAKLGPSRATAGLRNGPYPSIVPGGWPFGAVAGYGDNVNRYQIREQAVIIGSGCGFNVNFFKKRK